MTNEEHQQKIHVLNKNGIDQGAVQLVRVDTAYEDEINLIDLWLVLAKHRKLLILIVLAVMLLGVFQALSKPTLYSYSAALQVGLIPVGDVGK